MNLRISIACLAALAAVSAAPLAAKAEEAAAPQAAAVQVSAGKMLYNSKGYRLASVYRVNPEGAPQIILDGKLVTVPVSSLTEANGKLTTSLSKSELARGK